MGRSDLLVGRGSTNPLYYRRAPKETWNRPRPTRAFYMTESLKDLTHEPAAEEYINRVGHPPAARASATRYGGQRLHSLNRLQRPEPAARVFRPSALAVEAQELMNAQVALGYLGDPQGWNEQELDDEQDIERYADMVQARNPQLQRGEVEELVRERLPQMQQAEFEQAAEQFAEADRPGDPQRENLDAHYDRSEMQHDADWARAVASAEAAEAVRDTGEAPIEADVHLGRSDAAGHGPTDSVLDDIIADVLGVEMVTDLEQRYEQLDEVLSGESHVFEGEGLDLREEAPDAPEPPRADETPLQKEAREAGRSVRRHIKKGKTDLVKAEIKRLGSKKLAEKAHVSEEEHRAAAEAKSQSKTRKERSAAKVPYERSSGGAGSSAAAAPELVETEI